MLHPWIAYVILLLFTLANSDIYFQGFDFGHAVSQPVTLGIFTRLVVGKPVGIAIFSLATLVSKRHLIEVSFLGGIGFTMSLFITGLSFTDPLRIDLVKFAIVAASILSGILGYLVLGGADAVPVDSANQS